MRNLIRKLLRARRLEILPSAAIATFLEIHDIDLAIDVGANVGQFARKLRNEGYGGRILSFEPVREAFDALSAKTARDGRWEARHCAVGAAPGEVSIGVSENSVFSSIKPLTPFATLFDKDSATVRHEKVAVVRLDDALAGDPAQRIFVKIDTQGYEQEVLAGALGLLGRCRGIQLELPIDALYEDVWTFEEGLAFMGRKGFTLAQIRPVNFSPDDGASAIEFDCVFRRS